MPIHHGIERVIWPTNSPDMNPIEQLWDRLKRSIGLYRRQDELRTLVDVRRLVVEEWDAIPQIRITRLIQSMRARCAAVIRARSGHTRY